MAEPACAAASRSLVVSRELTILRGRPGPAPALPDRAVALMLDAARASLVCIAGDALAGPLAAGLEEDQVALILDAAVFARFDAAFPIQTGEIAFRLPAELRPVLAAMIGCDMAGEAGDLYRAAKAIELICEITRVMGQGGLVPFVAESGLSLADTQRIMNARRLIDERWREPLTLSRIAGHCGVNREKLTRGFRTLFACTVAEAILERRLAAASEMLVGTELPVSTIGYRNGYLNNASFSRAFARRFGMTPSDFRARRLAA